MKRSMVEDTQVARVILNLGHLHLHLQETTLENLEDGQSPSNTSSTPPHSTIMVDRFPNSSVRTIQCCYSDINYSNSLFYASTDSPTIVSTSILSPSTNTDSHHFTHLSHNSNNILPSCCCTHSPCSHILSPSRLCPSSGGKEGKCGPGHYLGTPTKESEESEEIQMEFNTNIQYNIEPEKQSQLYAGTQHSNDKILKEFDTEKQQNHEAHLELKLDIQMQIDSENQQKLDESVQKELGKKQQITFEKDLELILNIEMQQEFDEKLLNHQIDEEKQNICKNDVQKILANEIINLKIQGQVDNETCVVEQTVTYDNENLSEFELEVQQIDEIEIEKLNHKIQDIEKLITDVLNSRQTIDKQTEHILNADLQAEIINKIKQKYKNLQKEIEEIYSHNDVDLEPKIIENIDKTYIYSIYLKFLENLIILLHQESIPFFERIRQLYTLYFQEEFNTKLDLKEDGITQQESNENAQKVNAIQHLVNENTVPMVKERNIFNFFGKNGDEIGPLKTFEEKNKAIQSNSEDSEIKIDDFEDNIQINSEVQEESEMEIEDFDDDIRVCSVAQEESKVKIEDFEDNKQYEYEQNTEQFNEINEVIKIIDEYEIKSTSSADEFISTEDESNSTEDESNSTKDEFNSTEDESNSTEDESNSTEDESNSTKDESNSKKDESNFTEDESNSTEDESNSTKDESNFTGKEFSSFSKEFNRNTRHRFLTQEFDRVSNEKIVGLTKQKHLEDKLHRQLMNFQKEFFIDLKLKYEETCKLKVNNNCNFVVSKFFDEQQQTFFKLKDEFKEIKQEYKNFVLQQIFKELQKKQIDENPLKEIEVFLEKSDDESNIKVKEDIQNEYVDLQHNCYELEPEFFFNVPFECEEDNPSQCSLQQKSYNLFEKLNFIYKQKLCGFCSSNQWVENHLHPSSLLDSLFEDPREVKPNVLLITLFSIDIGYSISIITKRNEPRTEIFFSYAEDSILKYVENEQLSPHLLNILNNAEPTLFYCGCIIAEIDDQINGVPGKLYRILLRPTYMTILSDVHQIMAENSHVYWSYKKKLKLESILLLVSRPTMCMDSSPIAGLAVNLQHQILSYRNIKLNPLKMKYKSEHRYGKTQCENIKSPTIPVQLSDNLQTIETPNRKTSLMVDNKIKKSVQFCNTKKLKKNPNKNIEMLNMDLKKDQTVYASSLKIQEKPTITKTNGHIVSSLTNPNDSLTDVVQEELDTAVASTNSNISPYEILSTDCIRKPKHLSLQRDINKLSILKCRDVKKLKPYDTSKHNYLKDSTIIADPPRNFFKGINHQLLLNDISNTTCEVPSTQLLTSQYVGNNSVLKHVHTNEICLVSGTKTAIDNMKMLQNVSLEEQIAADLELNHKDEM